MRVNQLNKTEEEVSDRGNKYYDILLFLCFHLARRGTTMNISWIVKLLNILPLSNNHCSHHTASKAFHISNLQRQHIGKSTSSNRTKSQSVSEQNGKTSV